MCVESLPKSPINSLLTPQRTTESNESLLPFKTTNIPDTTDILVPDSYLYRKREALMHILLCLTMLWCWSYRCKHMPFSWHGITLLLMWAMTCNYCRCFATSTQQDADTSSSPSLELVWESFSVGDVIDAVSLRDGLALFLAYSAESQQYELWSTDGTASGTTALLNARMGVKPNIYIETIHDNIAYFTASTADFGSEAWRSDGTVIGTYMIKDLTSGPGDSRPTGFVALKDVVTFFAYKDGIFQPSYKEFWATDGTADGTTLLVSPEEYGISFSSGVYKLNDNLGMVYQHFGDIIWVTDGTVDGTKRLDYDFEDCTGTSQFLLEYEDGLQFFSCTGSGIWATDGTSEGTQKLLDLERIEIPLYVEELGNFKFFGGTVNGKHIFSSNSVPTDSNFYARYIYATDGTRDGTTRLVELESPEYITFGVALSGNTDGTVDTPKLLFAKDGQLMTSDGTADGTTTMGLYDISPDVAGEGTLRLIPFKSYTLIAKQSSIPNNSTHTSSHFWATIDGTIERTSYLTTTISHTGETTPQHYRFRQLGPVIWLLEQDVVENGTMDPYTASKSRFEIVLLPEKEGDGFSSLGSFIAATGSFGRRIEVHSKIVRLTDDTVLFVSSAGHSLLSIWKLTLPPSTDSSSSTSAADPTTATTMPSLPTTSFAAPPPRTIFPIVLLFFVTCWLLQL